MALNGSDSVRKAEVKIKQSENPLEAAYAIRETCQIPTRLSHELIETKIEYGLEFQFEFFILHLNSGILKQIINFKFLFYEGTLDLADDYKRSHDTNSARQ